MHTVTEFNTLKSIELIERDINAGRILSVPALIARVRPIRLNYSAYMRLYKMLKAK